MFCNSCGKEVNANGKFCPNCGAPLPELRQEPTSVQNVLPSVLSSRDGVFWASVIVPFIIIILMFQKWITVPGAEMIWGREQSISLFGLFSKLRYLNNLIEQFSGDNSSMGFVMLIGGIVVILCVISIVLLAWYLVATFLNKQGVGKIGRLAMASSAFLSVVVMLIVAYINHAFEEQLYGIISGVFATTGVAKAILILSIVSFVLLTLKEKKGSDA